jgi:hypothetical protein
METRKSRKPRFFQIEHSSQHGSSRNPRNCIVLAPSSVTYVFSSYATTRETSRDDEVGIIISFYVRRRQVATRNQKPWRRIGGSPASSRLGNKLDIGNRASPCSLQPRNCLSKCQSNVLYHCHDKFGCCGILSCSGMDHIAYKPHKRRREGSH